MSAALTPKANVAMLTLQLRAAQREAEEAERAEAEWTPEPVDEVRRRLDSLLADRRRQLDAELVAARGAAEARLAEARARAVAVEPVPEAAPEHDAVPGDELEPARRVAEPQARRVETLPNASPRVRHGFEAPPQASAPQPAEESVEEVAESDAEHDVRRGLDTPAHAPATRPPEEPEPVETTGLPAPLPAPVAFDPNALATAVAAAVAAVLDARPQARTYDAPVPPQWFQAAVAAQPQQKKSFWAGLWHADVLLALMAMAIILVILLAWST